MNVLINNPAACRGVFPLSGLTDAARGGESNPERLKDRSTLALTTVLGSAPTAQAGPESGGEERMSG